MDINSITKEIREHLRPTVDTYDKFYQSVVSIEDDQQRHKIFTYFVYSMLNQTYSEYIPKFDKLYLLEWMSDRDKDSLQKIIPVDNLRQYCDIVGVKDGKPTVIRCDLFADQDHNLDLLDIAVFYTLTQLKKVEGVCFTNCNQVDLSITTPRIKFFYGESWNRVTPKLFKIIRRSIVYQPPKTWEDRFAELQTVILEYGRLPSAEDDNTFEHAGLYQWMQTQKTSRTLSKVRKQQLNQLYLWRTFDAVGEPISTMTKMDIDGKDDDDTNSDYNDDSDSDPEDGEMKDNQQLRQTKRKPG